LIHFSDVTKQYGPKILYQNASFQIRPKDRIGLVGQNGSGKSTLFKILVKEERIDSGTLTIPDKVVIGYFSQDVSEMKGRSALEEVLQGSGRISELKNRMDDLESKLGRTEELGLDDDALMKLVEKYSEVQQEFESRGGYDLEPRAKAVLTGLGIGPEDYDRPTDSFSGGWKMRIELAKILVLQPDLLLMDEPTNHLDLETIIWLEEWIKNYEGALMMTSHDREFMNRAINRVLEVANKQVNLYSGNYDYYEQERGIRMSQLLALHQKQQDMLAKEEEFIARFAARASHAAQVQSRVKKLEKIERIEIPAEERVAQFDFPVPPRSGNDVVKLEGVYKEWIHPNGTVKKVLNGVTTVIKRLDRIAVVGVNGAGKSTLLKLIAGQTEPTSGTCQIGSQVSMGYFSQSSLDVLNPENTIFEEIQSRLNDASIGYIRNLLGAFLFSGDEVHKKIKVLSGGEKSRVVLATILSKPVNLLILDEPTNHLDIKTREVLLAALKNYEGTAVFVSHDRHFLKEVSNRVFSLGPHGLYIYEGSYGEFLESKL